MSRLAEQITRLTEEDAILEEVLAAVQELAGLEGAVYAVESTAAGRPRGGAGRRRDGRVIAALASPRRRTGPLRSRSGGAPAARRPDPGDRPERAVIAGMAPRRGDPQRDIVLAALARFGSVALENASLQAANARRSPASRVRTKKLRQVLLVHETLTADVIGGHGIQSVADSLAGLVDGEVARAGIARQRARARARARRDSVEPPGGESGARTIIAECATAISRLRRPRSRTRSSPGWSRGSRLARARSSAPPSSMARC